MPKSWDRFWRTPLILRPCIFEFNAHLLNLEERSIKICRRKNRREQQSHQRSQESQKSTARSQSTSSPRGCRTLPSSQSTTKFSKHSTPTSQISRGSNSTSCSQSLTPEHPTQPTQPPRKKFYRPKKFGHLKEEELKALLHEKGMKEEDYAEHFASSIA